jgi:histidyl-tRNA synthetase
MTDRQPLETEPYKGVRDFYPADWARLSAIFAKEREVLASFGYEEYQASPLERSEMYESKGNEEIINEQTYTFEDRGGRRVTLRPEMTPTLARMISGKRRELPFPQRWFSIGNRFRYERPQKGRLREFFQTDVDLLGLPFGEADQEVVGLAYRIVKAFGAHDNDFIIRVNNRKLLMSACTAAGCDTPDKARAYLRLLDKKEKIPAEKYAEELAALGITDPMQIINDATEGEVAENKKLTQDFVAELQKRGVKNAVFDPTLARGFDYYTGTVFEVFDTNPENSRALFGGGRYDELVTLFGGDPIPAVGFAIGDVSFADFLETHNLLPETTTAPQVYVGTPSPADAEHAITFANHLRAQGLRVFMNLAANKGVGDQVKDASRRSIPFFIAYGAEEATSKKVRAKELATGTELKASVKDIGAKLRKKLS